MFGTTSEYGRTTPSKRPLLRAFLRPRRAWYFISFMAVGTLTRTTNVDIRSKDDTHRCARTLPTTYNHLEDVVSYAPRKDANASKGMTSVGLKATCLLHTNCRCRFPCSSPVLVFTITTMCTRFTRSTTASTSTYTVFTSLTCNTTRFTYLPFSLYISQSTTRCNAPHTCTTIYNGDQVQHMPGKHNTGKPKFIMQMDPVLLRTIRDL